MKKSVAFIIFSILLIAACGKKEGGSTSTNSDTPKNSTSMAISKHPKNSPSIEGLYLGMDKKEYWKVVSQDWPKKDWICPEWQGTSLKEAEKRLNELGDSGKHYVAWNCPGGLTLNSIVGIDVVLHDNKLISIGIDGMLLRRMLGLSYGEDRTITATKLSQTYNIDLKRTSGNEDIFIDFNHGWKINLDAGQHLVLEYQK